MEPQSLAESPKQATDDTCPGSSANCCQGNKSCEDGSVWGDSDDELDQEWKSRREQFYNHGYREGISAGQNDSAQAGFNGGFKDSVLAGYNWGRVRGVTSALAYLPEELRKKMVEAEDKRMEFKSLHESARSISTDAALKLFYDDMNKKKASPESGNPDSHLQQPRDQISDSNVLENHFQNLQLLLQQAPEVLPKCFGKELEMLDFLSGKV